MYSEVQGIILNPTTPCGLYKTTSGTACVVSPHKAFYRLKVIEIQEESTEMSNSILPFARLVNPSKHCIRPFPSHVGTNALNQ